MGAGGSGGWKAGEAPPVIKQVRMSLRELKSFYLIYPIASLKYTNINSNCLLSSYFMCNEVGYSCFEMEKSGCNSILPRR